MKSYNSIIRYIKKTYPKVIFSPLKMEYKNALGFVISNSNLIIGFIDGNGNLCKLIEPIDLRDLSKSNKLTVKKIINALPIVKGFTEADRLTLLKFFEFDATIENTVTRNEQDIIKKELEKRIKNESRIKYQILYESVMSELVLINKKYENKLKDIKNEYIVKINKLSENKEKLLNEKNGLLKELEEYKIKLKEYVKNNECDKGEISNICEKIKIEKAEIEMKLDILLEREKQQLRELEEKQKIINESLKEIKEKQKEIDNLKFMKKSIKTEKKEIMDEIDKEKDKLKKEIVEKEKIINELNEKSNKLTEEKEKINNEMKEIVNDKNKTIIEKENEISKLQNKVTEKEMKIKELKKECEKNEEEKEKINKEIEGVNDEKTNEENKLKQRIKELEEKEKELINENKDLKYELDSLLLNENKYLNEIKELSKVKDREMKDKELECENLKEVQNKLSSTITELNKTKNTLEELERERTKEKNIFEEENNRKLIEIENKNELIKQNTIDLKNLLDEKNVLEEKLKNAIDDTTGQLGKDLNKEKSLEESNIEKYKNEIKKKDNEILMKQKEISKLNEKIVKTDIEMKGEKTKIEKILKIKDDNIQELQKSEKLLKDENEKLKNKLQEIVIEINKENIIKLKENEDKIINLEREIEETKKQIEKTREMSDKFEKEKKMQEEEFNKSKNILQDKISDYDEKIKMLENDKKNIENEKIRLEKELNKKGSEKGILEDKIKELDNKLLSKSGEQTEEIKNKLEKIEELEIEKTKNETTIKSKEQEIEKLKVELNNLVIRYTENENKLNEYINIQKENLRSTAKYEETINNLKKEIILKETEILKLKQDYDVNNEKIKILESRNLDKEKGIEKIKELELEIQKLGEDKIKNETELNNIKEIYNKESILLKKEIEEKKMEIKDLTEKDSNKEKKIGELNNLIKEFNELKMQTKKENEEIRLKLEKTNDELQRTIEEKRICQENAKTQEIVKEEIENSKKNLISLSGTIDKLKIENEKLKKELGDTNKKIEEIEKIKDIERENTIKEINEKSSKKEKELIELNKTIEELKIELENVRNELNKSNLEKEALLESKKKCQKKILEENEEIKSKIQEYKQKSKEWIENMKSGFGEYRTNLLNELKQIESELKKLYNLRGDLSKTELQKLKQEIKDIKIELESTVTENLRLISEKQDLEKRNETLLNKLQIVEKFEPENDKLNKKLKELRKRIDELEGAKQEAEMSISSYCYDDFIRLNNILTTRKKIIDKIYNEILIDENDDILKERIGKNRLKEIKEKFNKLRNEFEQRLKILDIPSQGKQLKELEKYLDKDNYLIEEIKNNKKSQEIVEFCEGINTTLKFYEETKEKFNEFDLELTNIYEDLSGAVRVYIRIKKHDKDTGIITAKGKCVDVWCGEQKNRFGPFYGVYPSNMTNLSIYTGNEEDVKEKMDVNSSHPGLFSTINQIKEGYSIVLFGYGLSGSGKTFTLLGDEKNNIKGILHYALEKLGAKTIKIKNIFEEYIFRLTTSGITEEGVEGNIIDLVGNTKKISEKRKKDDFNLENINKDNINIEQLNDLTDQINRHRKEKNRIKETPNNPESSRSHLYMIFEIMFENNVRGHLTIIDMAGKESPEDISGQFFKNSLKNVFDIVSGSSTDNLVLKSTTVDKNKIKSARKIFEEGIYINESINHLSYYFINKNKKKEEKFVKNSYKNYRPELSFTDPKKIGSVMTIPILDYLDRLSSSDKESDAYKPSKFIMICCVRQEPVYCTETISTLELADRIKSSQTSDICNES